MLLAIIFNIVSLIANVHLQKKEKKESIITFCFGRTAGPNTCSAKHMALWEALQKHQGVMMWPLHSDE